MESLHSAQDEPFETLMSDSGYGSSENNFEKEANPHPSSRSANVLHAPKTDPIGELLGLKRFEKNVDKAVLDRFVDITERLHDPLIQYLRKWKRNYRPLAMRLMVLGDTYQNAQPRVVVLCPASSSKRVGKFFEKTAVVAMCRPSDSTQVKLEVLVVGHTLSPTSGDEPIEVFGSAEDISEYRITNTGVLIKVQRQGGSRFAVMGGIIKVQKDDHTSKLYGLTVGHVLEHRDEDDNFKDDSSLSERDSKLEDVLALEGLSDDDDDDEDEDEDEIMMEPDWTDPLAATFSRIYHDWKKLGKMADAPRSVGSRNRDWVLIENIERCAFQSNRQTFSTRTPKEPNDIQNRALGAGIPREVLVMSGSSPQSGTLSAMPAVALLSSGKSFTNVFTLTVNNNSCVPNGSSGSWVVDRNTLEVYGHVVATDPFGDIFVVPMWDIFQDIKEDYGATKVTIVPPSDLFGIEQASPTKPARRRKQYSGSWQPKKKFQVSKHAEQDWQEENSLESVESVESVSKANFLAEWNTPAEADVERVFTLYR